MQWSQAMILGFVQGLTEFLPISSSAHLILINEWLGHSDEGLVFDVATHTGTLAAVLWYFRGDLVNILKNGTVSEFAANGHRIAGWLVVASVPIALVGGWFSHDVETHLRTSTVIAVTTIVFGLLLWVSDHLGRKDQPLTTTRVIWMGLAQVLALIPGTSRSGITISAGLLAGLTMQRAARFSFLMAIPAIAGAAIMSLPALSKDALMAANPGPIIVGAVVAGVTALATIHFFLRLVDRIGMLPFVIYRLALGIVLLLIS